MLSITGFCQYKAGTGKNNNKPAVLEVTPPKTWKVTPPNNNQNGQNKIDSTKQLAPESFINANLPLKTKSSPDETVPLKTPSSPDETASSLGMFPKWLRRFLRKEKLVTSIDVTWAAEAKELAFNNANVGFNLVKEGTLTFLAFKTNKMGKEWSAEAERQAISRAGCYS
jgi:hypothetical protein